MKKHRLNFYPEASPENSAELRNGIEHNGYDKTQPVVTTKVTFWMDGTDKKRATN